MIADEAHHRIVDRRAVRLVAVERDPHGGVDEDRAEDRDYPAEVMDERHAGENQGAAQDERAEHAPEEHAVLVLGGHGEALEEEDEHEQVVDGERLLQQVPGKVLQPLLAAVTEPDEEAESDGEDDPEDAPPDGFLERRALVAGGDLEIHREHDHHADEEPRPEKRAADIAGAEIDGVVHRPAPAEPRGVERLFCRKISRTGTRSLKRSRRRFTRNRR